MFQTHTFRAQECSRFALSGKRMFPTLTFRVEESSRFSQLQGRRMFKILSTSGLKNVQDSQFQGPKMFKILTFRIQECSRFSVSAWKKNVWTKFCVSGKNLDVQKSEFQGRNFCWDLKVSPNGKSSVQVACM